MEGLLTATFGVSRPRRRGLAAVLALVAALTAGALPANSGTGSKGGAASNAVGAATYFLSICAVSHRSFDDPIVFPGKPRLSHNHTFIGNVSTNAFSTLSSLRKHGTTCTPQADTAAYWAPTLLLNDRPVHPIGATIYYRRLTASPVKPFPPGLRMVAGNSRSYRPQPLSVTYWDCGVVKATSYGTNRSTTGRAAPSTTALPSTTAESSNVPSCPATATLQLHVNFPDCWNGKTLDSPNHKSHMAYSVNGACPPGHPIPVPALSFVLRYRPPGPGTVILSSGGQHSGHADFINAWNQAALTKLVDTCLDGQADPTMEGPHASVNTSQLYNQC